MNKLTVAGLLAGAVIASSLLSACSSEGRLARHIEMNGQYWQRSEASSATYTQGPKAQQMLNRDISRCVVELRELERLGALRNALPQEKNPSGEYDRNDPAESLADWDTPERDGALYAEHTDYPDFETCMLSKGWERVKYVPYDVAERARDTYIESHISQQRRSKSGERDKPEVRDVPFDNLNQ